MEELDHQPTDYYLLKTHANSFFQTNLQAPLIGLGVESIEFCGAQTEYCVDTTIRFAHSLGYHCWMKSDLHTTVDSLLLIAPAIIAHHEAIWENRFLNLL